jgi:hypothetical protein
MTLARHYGSRLAVSLVSGLGLLVVLGCGDDTGLPQRYSVTGTVTYKGKNVPKGRVDFVPEGTGGEARPATGDIVDGSYSLTTAETDDGAIPGTYKVTVTAMELDVSAGKVTAGGGQQFAQSKSAAKALKSAEYLVPKKYSSPETTDLTAEVEAKSNKIDLNLDD